MYSVQAYLSPSVQDKVLDQRHIYVQGIRAMDGQVQELRALLNRENALLVTMKEIADPQGRYTEIEQPALAPGDVWSRSWADSPEGQRWNESMQVSHRSVSCWSNAVWGFCLSEGSCQSLGMMH